MAIDIRAEAAKLTTGKNGSSDPFVAIQDSMNMSAELAQYMNNTNDPIVLGKLKYLMSNLTAAQDLKVGITNGTIEIAKSMGRLS